MARSTASRRTRTGANREKWDDYVAAVNDMIDHTSTSRAPWTLVEAQDKRWARVKVLETLCDRIQAALRA
jgi:polyphosphate kinase 2 (PPK2 family)